MRKIIRWTQKSRFTWANTQVKRLPSTVGVTRFSLNPRLARYIQDTLGRPESS